MVVSRSPPVHIVMTSKDRGTRVGRDVDDVVVIEELGENGEKKLPLCLIGKVLTAKAFNAYGFLEAMKRAMNPTKGFTAKEIGPNLFSFHFRSHIDLMEVKKHEPWHFEKHLVILKEITEGEQPSTMAFHTTGMWGFGRSIRVRVNLDVTKPLKSGVNIATKGDRMAWIPFKFEKLPSFCFLCGTLGHMKRECDLADDRIDILTLPDDELPYGNWMKASPAKKASVILENMKEKCVTSPLRRRLFDKIRAEIEVNQHETEAGDTPKTTGETGNTPNEVTEISEVLGKIAVSVEKQEKEE
ncbi:hypothetical protein ACS0TY_017419 [Phlomoides rotata]